MLSQIGFQICLNFQIAAFLGVIMLPWAFKLLVGPLMDHYEYLPMGKRRPWVLAMQLGMVVSLFGLGLVEDPASQVYVRSKDKAATEAGAEAASAAGELVSVQVIPRPHTEVNNAFGNDV